MDGKEEASESVRPLSRDSVLGTTLCQAMAKLETNNIITWQSCEKIYKDYISESNVSLREYIAKRFLTELHDVKAAHSIGMRHKEADSLIRKIVIKKKENTNKYKDISQDNYDIYVRDLIGVRILIRFKHEWRYVHEQLHRLFHNASIRKIKSSMDEDETLENMTFMLQDDHDYCYFAEKPIAYICDEDERAMYVTGGMPIGQVKESKQKYRSVHYIIRYHGFFIEVQVRTIFEEGWSECDHNLCYKEPDITLKDLQQKTSSVLSGLAHQADELSGIMYKLKSEYDIKKKQFSSSTKTITSKEGENHE